MNLELHGKENEKMNLDRIGLDWKRKQKVEQKKGIVGENGIERERENQKNEKREKIDERKIRRTGGDEKRVVGNAKKKKEMREKE